MQVFDDFWVGIGDLRLTHPFRGQIKTPCQHSAQAYPKFLIYYRVLLCCDALHSAFQINMAMMIVR